MTGGQGDVARAVARVLDERDVLVLRLLADNQRERHGLSSVQLNRKLGEHAGSLSDLGRRLGELVQAGALRRYRDTDHGQHTHRYRIIENGLRALRVAEGQRGRQ